MDMSGGAWTIGIMRILAQLKAPVNVIGVVAAAENLPGGGAYRPGDVIGSLEGKSIEVLNTDAEGRIVLADGLAYARKLGAIRLVDMATLTGAIVVALGNSVTGVFTSDQDWTDLFLKTAINAGERAWQMPLFPNTRSKSKAPRATCSTQAAGRAAPARRRLSSRNLRAACPGFTWILPGPPTPKARKPTRPKVPAARLCGR